MPKAGKSAKQSWTANKAVLPARPVLPASFIQPTSGCDTRSAHLLVLHFAEGPRVHCVGVVEKEVTLRRQLHGHRQQTWTLSQHEHLHAYSLQGADVLWCIRSAVHTQLEGHLAVVDDNLPIGQGRVHLIDCREVKLIKHRTAAITCPGARTACAASVHSN